jgi:formylglycine-generating enzyme required for sulfatase activity
MNQAEDKEISRSEVHTDGGTGVSGDVHAGTFIGRDQIIVISGYTAYQLNHALQRLVPLLRNRNTRIYREGVGEQSRLFVDGGDVRTTLSLDAAAAMAASSAADESTYLTTLLLDPRLHRWTTQFVPLAGMLTVQKDPRGIVDLHQEFTLLHVEGEGATRRVHRERLSDITTVVERYKTFVILGAPGAGKTTVLRKLTLDGAQRRLQTGQGRLPFFITLADYRGYPDPYTFLSAQWSHRMGDTDVLHRALSGGNLLLLCDSVNEMPRADAREYRDKVRAWREFVKQWPGNQFIFACRGRDYSEPLGLQQVEIEPLDEERIHRFLDAYLSSEQATAMWQHLTTIPERLMDLASNPYLLTMLMAVCATGGDLPANRARLFDSFITTLLHREAGKGHPDWLPVPALFGALSVLAWALQEAGEGTRLPWGEAMKMVPAEVEGPDGPVATSAKVVLCLGLAATVLERELIAENEEVRFYHHLLQETLAAQEMVRRWRKGDDLDPLWRVPWRVGEMPDTGPLSGDEPLPPPPATGWEETTLLAAGLCSEPGAFVEAVEKVNPILAARCLTESGIQATGALCDQVRKDLKNSMEDERVHLRSRIAAGEDLGWLGDPRFKRLEDTGVDAEVLVPPMVEVPAGSFLIGSTSWQIRLLARRGFNAGDEAPCHRLSLSAYQIGRFPVTNGEYGCFIRAGGYSEPTVWTEGGRAWLRGEDVGGGAVEEILDLRRQVIEDPGILDRLVRAGVSPREVGYWKTLATMSDEEAEATLTRVYAERPRDRPTYWDDDQYNNPVQPVVGVNWFEAMAYSNWLARMFQMAGRLPEGYTVRLPTEAEWEKAARGTRGRNYPWGRQWDAKRANTLEGHVLRPSPVGIYPSGGSPYDCLDLAGNVWEWTHSLYRPYLYKPDDGRENVEDTGRRVVRGGSWIYPHRSARGACRGYGRPGGFSNGVGFRLVVAPALGST